MVRISLRFLLSISDKTLRENIFNATTSLGLSEHTDPIFEVWLLENGYLLQQ
jgi:hypothetical protein